MMTKTGITKKLENKQDFTFYKSAFNSESLLGIMNSDL